MGAFNSRANGDPREPGSFGMSERVKSIDTNIRFKSIGRHLIAMCLWLLADAYTLFSAPFRQALNEMLD